MNRIVMKEKIVPKRVLVGFKVILKAGEMWRCTEAKCQLGQQDALMEKLDLSSIVVRESMGLFLSLLF